MSPLRSPARVAVHDAALLDGQIEARCEPVAAVDARRPRAVILHGHHEEEEARAFRAQQLHGPAPHFNVGDVTRHPPGVGPERRFVEQAVEPEIGHDGVAPVERPIERVQAQGPEALCTKARRERRDRGVREASIGIEAIEADPVARQSGENRELGAHGIGAPARYVEAAVLHAVAARAIEIRQETAVHRRVQTPRVEERLRLKDDDGSFDRPSRKGRDCHPGCRSTAPLALLPRHEPVDEMHAERTDAGGVIFRVPGRFEPPQRVGDARPEHRPGEAEADHRRRRDGEAGPRRPDGFRILEEKQRDVQADHRRAAGCDGPLVRERESQLRVAEDVERLKHVGEHDGLVQRAALGAVGIRIPGAEGQRHHGGKDGSAGEARHQGKHERGEEQVDDDGEG